MIEPRVASPVPLRLALGAALVVLVLAVFAQARAFDFLHFDDQTYVSKNPNVTSGFTARSFAWAFTTGRAANWHPLTWLSHMTDVELFGLWAGGHHLTNVAIHSVTTLLLFVFLLRLVANPWTAAGLAAVWAIHPLRAESVAWIAERKDVLSGLFWMATVLAATQEAYAFALCFFLLGLLAKPMLVTLPFVLLLLDRWPRNRPWAPALVIEKIPFFAAAAASSIVTYLVQQSGGAVARFEQVPLTARIANAIVAVPTYLVRTIWPAHLAAFYPFDANLPGWLIFGSAVLVALLTGAAIVSWRRSPFVGVGWGWFCITLVPVVGLVQIGFQSTADRYTYIPSIGLLLVMAGGISRLERSRPSMARVVPWGLAAIVVPLALLAHRQTATWRDGVTLFTHAIEVTGPNYVAERHLAEALRDAGRVDEANAIRIRQLNAAALPGEREREARALLDAGRIKQAREILDVEVRDHPSNAGGLFLLGIALAMEDRLDEAAARFEQAAENAPTFAPAFYNLALAREKQGRDDDAIAAYERSLELDTENPDGLFNLARALARRGRAGEAAARLTELLKAQPNYPGAAALLDSLRSEKHR
jgi:hypothetical protein